MNSRSWWSSAAVCAVVAASLSAAAAPASAAPTTYYVDSVAGSDSNNGTSTGTAWKSLTKASNASLQPGDTVAFRRGSTFVGRLVPSSSGTEAAPIVYGAYGTGDAPVLTGSGGSGGDHAEAVLVNNQDHLTFRNLTISNNRKVARTGVTASEAYGLRVLNTSNRVLRGFTVEDVTVRDVSAIQKAAQFPQNSQTSIAFQTQQGGSAISDVTVRDTSIRFGTRFGVGINPVKSITGNPRVSNIVVNNLTCTQTGGSCILGRRAQNMRVSNSSVTDTGSTGNNTQVGRGSGGWIVDSVNVVINNNSFRGSRGDGDTAGFHIDGVNRNVLMESNLMYDNQGYGLEILGANEKVIVRYNVIVDSGWRQPNGGLFYTSTYNPQGPAAPSDDVHVYANTFAFERDQNIGFDVALTDSFVYNNIFEATGGAQITPLTTAPTSVRNLFTHNLFRNAGTGVVAQDAAPVTGDPGFVGGARGNAASFRLTAGSRAVDAGVSRPHPSFAALGTGVFSSIPATPTVDYYGNPLAGSGENIGADQS